MRLRNIIPASLRSSSVYRHVRAAYTLNRFRSPERIFSDIYQTNKWGGPEGSPYSGTGSRGDVVDAYVAYVIAFIERHSPSTVVDLGCGDFYVGAKIADACDHYIGVDVVPTLIAEHQHRHATDRISFACLDITRDELPSGDICLIRQVLQHLSNRQIAAVLRQCRQYRYVLVTEHHPHPDELTAFNLDKAPGSGTRLDFGSTVDLGAPPFNLPVSEVLALPAAQPPHAPEDIYSRGSIRTYLLDGRLIAH
ncbi:MAG TPA: class I SAM-dependent methyltransferase [Xanthobacteraceae bacterium]|nr:class I SAM-dependent methyltransferase [Xanthobacteraceae bacterium]